MIQKFKLNDIEIYHTIGKGGYGTVKLAREKNSSVYFALKILKKTHIIEAKQVDHVHSEFVIGQELDHPFVVKLMGYSQDNSNLYFAFEFVPGGDLFTYLRYNKRFPVGQSMLYAAQIVLIIEYLHTKSIVYRDLKPENLLIKNNGYLKIIDFGLAKIVHNRTYTFCGTPEYLAPEVILKTGYGKPVDWWSLGVIIYEMIAGIDPFHDPDAIILYENITNCRLNFPVGFDKDAKSLIKNLLKVNLSKRYGNMKNGVNDIKRHRWFKNLNWEAVYNQEIEMYYIPTIRFQGDTSNFYIYPPSNTISDDIPVEPDPFRNW
jgi:serine/threonine protein kinase